MRQHVTGLVRLPFDWGRVCDHDRSPDSDLFWCYRWSGTATPAERRDLTRETPPYLLTDWLRKPPTMRAATVPTREQAITWLWHQIDTITTQLPALFPDRVRHLRDGFTHTWHTLGHDRITVNAYTLTGGRETELVIIPNRSPDLTRQPARTR